MMPFSLNWGEKHREISASKETKTKARQTIKKSKSISEEGTLGLKKKKSRIK